MPRPVRSAARQLAPRLAAIAFAAAAGGAGAQVVERNLPPAPSASGSSPTPPAPRPAERDDRAIGPALAGVVALGPTDLVRPAPAAGIDLSALPRMNRASTRADLARFLGRPLSRKLIAEVAAEVTRIYRRGGFPFVSVTAPEQEIGSGVLQLRVIEFRAGRVSASGGHRTPPRYVEGRLRQRPGDVIDGGALGEDLDWLNRNPFRQVHAVFSPGASLGSTDLDLPLTETRPWRAYGGYAQSGSQATGRDRYFLGAQVGGLPLFPDALVSYQFTGSADAFTQAHPRYATHAARVDLPFAPRQAFDLTYDHIESNQPVQDFVSRQVTNEATLSYVAALSNLVPPALLRVRGDVRLGVEARQSERSVLFGGVRVQAAAIDVFQVFAGYSGNFRDRFGATGLSAALHISPGDMNSRNGDAAYAAFSQGRVSSANYGYATLQASRATALPHGFTLGTDITAQYASRALPDTEQMALGAPSLVRGYSLDDGAFDSGLIIRNELRGPASPVLRASSGSGDRLEPRVFVDVGYGFEHRVGRTQTTVSAGVGADYRLGPHLFASADAACALADALFTRRGDCRVESRVSVQF